MHTYVVPRGGLFGWVASPHYFGEILSFVGYAMMSDLLPVWGNALVASAYLSSRANSTLKWNQGEMPLRIPTGWRRLVPFTYWTINSMKVVSCHKGGFILVFGFPHMSRAPTRERDEKSWQRGGGRLSCRLEKLIR